MSGSLLILVAYGIDVKPKNDPILHLAEQSLDIVLHALNPGTFLVVSALTANLEPALTLLAEILRTSFHGSNTFLSGYLELDSRQKLRNGANSTID